MRPRIARHHCRKIVLLCSTVFCAAGFSPPVFASLPGKVILRKNVSQTQRAEVENRLRRISGWSDLVFDSDRVLRLGTKEPQGGSRIAREFLERAVSGERTILLEDASSRKDVVFCRVVQAKLPGKESSQSNVFVVLIDFSDFLQVTGDRRARASFDVGWAVLHEIDHAVADSEDSGSSSSAGNCEDHINEMRREMGLPIRLDYFFSYVPMKSNPSLISSFVRLSFGEQVDDSGKLKRYWLVWDAGVVGGLTDHDKTLASAVSVSSVSK